MTNKTSNHKFQIIKKIFLPVIATLLVGLVYFGINGVQAELSSDKEKMTQKDNLADRPLHIVAVDDNQIQDVANPSLTQTPATTQIFENPEVKNIPATQVESSRTKVTMRINAGRRAGNYFTDYISNENAFELLKRITQNDIKYTDWGEDLGIFVDCIGGICRTDGYEYFWSFYINSRLSEVGASGYIVQSNDVIEWKYAEADFRY